MDELFETPVSPAKKNFKPIASAPLAAKLRPLTLSQVIGQEHIIGEGKLLRRMIEGDRVSSVILYGPPGTGKTTLAHIISLETKSAFVSVNAVTSNVAEIRKVVELAEKNQALGKRTLLFIDEIHRFNKAQQDVLMPHVESGLLILIGATTHNPFFSLNAPLLSRSTLFELKPLNPDALEKIIRRGMSELERTGLRIKITEEALKHIASQAGGDARKSLNLLETGALLCEGFDRVDGVLDLHISQEACQKAMVRYDRDEDDHYDTISALIKSLRGSDPDSAIYWLAKMIHAGEDPRFIVRRLVIFASEDIGNSDPQALLLAVSGMQAVEFVGMPEARIVLAQLVTYLALAPKSNASYVAIDKALTDIRNGKTFEVPDALKDSSYKSAKQLGRGMNYVYPHDLTNLKPSENPQPKNQYYTPQKIGYYDPKESGFEKILKERFQKIRDLK